MGNSKPPPAVVNLVDSYARLVASDVEIVLNDLRREVPAGSRVALRAQEAEIPAAFTLVPEGDRVRMVVTVPRSALRDGRWGLWLFTNDGDEGLGCRLLVQGDRPLVLLWGNKGRRSKPPIPRENLPVHGGRASARAVSALPGRIARALNRRMRRSA